jgi:hypothetical protein
MAQAKIGARIKDIKALPQEEKINTKPPPENHFNSYKNKTKRGVKTRVHKHSPNTKRSIRSESRKISARTRFG